MSIMVNVDDDVRLTVVVAPGRIGEPEAVGPLIEKLNSRDYLLYQTRKSILDFMPFLFSYGREESHYHDRGNAL